MKNKGENIFTAILNALEIKFNRKFSNQYYNQHPYKYNLYGISQMCSDYGIDNGGILIDEKLNNIDQIETPFVAHVGGDFAIVYNVGEKLVEYRSDNLNFKQPKSQFCDNWSGVVLLLEKTDKASEPNYELNSIIEKKELISKLVLVAFSLFFLVLGLVYSNTINNIEDIASWIISVLGIFTGFLLLQKQLDISGNYTDKICSLLKQHDCNNILESKYSKLFGRYSWSEIGFSFFLTNFIIISFLPILRPYYALISLFTLPYSFWSVWFQKFKAKQWCILCLIVQLLIWLTIAVNLRFYLKKIDSFTLFYFFTTISLYVFIFLIVNLLVRHVSNGIKLDNIKQEISSIKSNHKVVEVLLMEQEKYRCDILASDILFGNKNAEILITILSNPHCPPCAAMHKKVNDLLIYNNNICVQYIFSSFDETFDASNKLLIGLYLNNTESASMMLFDKWYRDGNQNPKEFHKKYCLFDLEDTNVVAEFEKHSRWKIDAKLEATPTVLVNGYKLPRNVQLEDFKFVTSLTTD